MWELGERWELAGSSGFGTNGAGDVSFQEAELGSDDNFIVWFQSVALGFPVSERSEFYLEYFGLFSHALEDESVQNYINLGIDILLSHNLVIDFRIGKGLSRDAEDFFAGVGGAYRF